MSLDGDGTAAVTVDSSARLGVDADGGRQGKSGIAGARIGAQDVLDYLQSHGIRIISCSHPHKDQMGGLISMVSDERIKSFSVVFVASIRGITGDNNLAALSKSGKTTWMDFSGMGGSHMH